MKKPKIIKQYVSFCGFTEDEAQAAFNQGFAPAVPLELAPNSIAKIDEFEWILAMNSPRASFSQNPIQGWGSCEPIFSFNW